MWSMAARNATPARNRAGAAGQPPTHFTADGTRLTHSAPPSMLEPICVCSQSICYSRRDGIRLRPAPELGLCFVYDPSGPNLYTLNTSAWLVLLLCNGATRDAMVTALH